MLADDFIKRIVEQLEKDHKPKDKILFMPRLEGKDSYSAEEVVEDIKDSRSELGKIARLGIRNLLRERRSR